MSLASMSAGGGGLAGVGGGAGMSMAHNAHAMARPMAPQPPPQSGIPGSGTAPPVSVAALGADLLDKHQSLSLKQVRNLSRFPLVAVDLYGSEPCVAMFPPKDPSSRGSPSLIGKLKSQVSLQASEAAHRTLRKWLTKSKGYNSLRTDALGPDGVTLERPHQLLGLRRLQDVPSFLRDSLPIVDEVSTPAIAEEAATTVGVSVTNGTLDGTSSPTGDDFDRVVYKVRLHQSKKSLTVLPEEAVTLVLALAQYHVARKTNKDDAESDDEEALEYPVAVAVPAWACHDSAMEALLDATGGSGVLVQRSMAALAGALLPGPEGSPNLILERLNQVRAAKHKEHQQQNPESTSFEYDALIVLLGMTPDGAECTAVQLSALQPDNMSCLYGNYKVLANVSYQHKDPLSQVEKCLKELYDNLDHIAPEADGPVGFVTYGTSKEQQAVKSKLDIIKPTLDTWEKVPLFHTKSDCVALGTAILGAVSHGRLSTLTEGANKKPKAQLGIRVQNVAPTAVGVRMNYHGGDGNKWSPVKVIFDFDRRVPAGPYPIDLNAAECAARRMATSELSDEQLSKKTKEKEGSKGIPKREEAALNFRLQVVQKWQRDGEWVSVGNVMSPLIKVSATDDETKVACESVALELSLGSTGIITSNLVGERESVVQATVSARNSMLRYYIGLLLAIAFFGGFLIKSFVEERVFERDTQRILAYYKHVLPGSIMDGDQHNARYLVWKYRGKKDKLWRRLEVKYGQPVLHVHEYADLQEESAPEEEEEVENLDETVHESADAGEEPDL